MQPQTALQTMLNRNIRINMFNGHFIGFSKEQRSLFRKQIMTPYICLRHLSQLIFAKLSMNIMTLYTDQSHIGTTTIFNHSTCRSYERVSRN